jgi:hypothetical protein
MTTLSTYLTNFYGGAQGVQGTTGSQGLQGTQGVQGIIGIGNTITNVGLTSISVSSYTFTTDDIGKFVSLTSGGGTISSDTYIAGDVITIFNDSNLTQEIVFESGINAYGVGTTSTLDSIVGIASNQCISILCADSNKFIVY